MLHSTFLKVASCDERRLQFAKRLPRVDHESEVNVRRRTAYVESKDMREEQITGSCTHENVGKLEFSSDSVDDRKNVERRRMRGRFSSTVYRFEKLVIDQACRFKVAPLPRRHQIGIGQQGRNDV